MHRRTFHQLGGLLELDFDDLGVTTNLAFERAEIVIRLGRWLDPRETGQTTALRTRRPVQLDCIDLVWLSPAHDTSPAGGSKIAIPIAAVPSMASDGPIKISKFWSWQHLLTC